MPGDASLIAPRPNICETVRVGAGWSRLPRWLSPSGWEAHTVWIIALGLGSLVFLSAAVIAAALILRGQWDEIGHRH
jgi:hypothetical protein